MTDISRQGRARDFERFLVFVDAIVAIAITLLVLPLVDLVADLPRDGSVSRLLSDHANTVYAFFLSFYVIAQMWFAHHRVVRDVVVQDPVVVRLTVLWTLAIVVLPFPTALVATAGGQAVTKLLYIGTMALSTALLAAMSLRIARTPAIRDAERAPDPVAGAVRTLLFAAALAISLAVPQVNYWPLLLLLLTGRLADLWRVQRSS